MITALNTLVPREFQDQLHDSQFLKRANPSSYYEYAAVTATIMTRQRCTYFTTVTTLLKEEQPLEHQKGISEIRVVFYFGSKQMQEKCNSPQALTFRHRASCILGQAFHYSPENAFYIFNQQIYFII